MSADASEQTRQSRRSRAVTALTALVAAAACTAALASCSTDSDSADSAATFSRTPTAADTGSFSGNVPSSLASKAASAEAAARASASAAAASVSARASEFEASVSAEVERANVAAQQELKDVQGKGNATADVSLTGKPRSDTGGLLAVVVNIRNGTDDTASYAVQVDFRDPDGKVAETRYVGAEDLDPGELAQPLAISRKPTEPTLTAEIAKAQRY